MITKIIPDTSSPFLSSVAADTAALAFTEVKWPNNPFHVGEIALQQAAGAQEHVMSYAPKFVRHYLPEQHRQFYPELPFLVVAARDETGAMWSTILEKTAASNTNNDDKNDAKFITSPDDRTLHIQTQPVPGDALHNAFSPQTQTDLGILGIQLETKRRNRVNGRAVADANGGLVFTVDQSFGNCPQYIKARVNWYKAAATSTNKIPSTKSKLSFDAKQLTTRQIQWIQSAETVFTASGYRGTGEDVRFGNDASHRGGSPGFMSVDVGNHNHKNGGQQQQHVISWTEYPGNNHFNTLGNILMDPRVGISIPNFETGGLLQVSGTATVEMGKLEDGGRKVHLYVAAVNELPAGSLPIRWPTGEKVQEEKIQVMVSKIVQESETVKSFYLEPADPFQTLTSFRAGQHLPIELALDDGEVLKRTYSLSAAPHSAKAGYYRISVKHEPNGKASSFLHNRVRVGDTLTVGQPAGDFVRQKTEEEKAPSSSTTTTVLLSSGIGVTPLLSMLHELVAEKSNNNSVQQVLWMHGARNGHHHAFKSEVDSLLQKHNNNNHSKQPSILQSRIFYSQPSSGTDNDNYGDQYPHNNITSGRMSAEAVRQQLVPLHTDEEEWKKAVFYMCGPPSFIADLESGLEALGVAPTNIQYETF